LAEIGGEDEELEGQIPKDLEGLVSLDFFYESQFSNYYYKYVSGDEESGQISKELPELEGSISYSGGKRND
jgi:hypothetical protein